MSSRLLWGAAVAALLAAAPVGALAVGSGGMGGGSMPSASEAPSAPAYDPAVEYQRGQAALQAQKYKDAARAFQHVTEADGSNANGWYMLGLSRAGAGDVKGAAKAYQRAVKLDAAPVAP